MMKGPGVLGSAGWRRPNSCILTRELSRPEKGGGSRRKGERPTKLFTRATLFFFSIHFFI